MPDVNMWRRQSNGMVLHWWIMLKCTVFLFAFFPFVFPLKPPECPLLNAYQGNLSHKSVNSKLCLSYISNVIIRISIIMSSLIFPLQSMYRFKTLINCRKCRPCQPSPLRKFYILYTNPQLFSLLGIQPTITMPKSYMRVRY